MRANPSETALSHSQNGSARQQIDTPHRLRESPSGFHNRPSTMQLQFLVASTVKAINPVVRKLMRLFRRTCCPPEHEFAVETALREGLANAIVHGNHGDPGKKVHVRCSCDTVQGIQIAIRDEGQGFDPAKVASPTAGENASSDHGRGIFLINTLMDEVHFEDGGREIHMRKRGPASH